MKELTEEGNGLRTVWQRDGNVYKQGGVVGGWSQSGREEHVLGLLGFRLRSSGKAEEEGEAGWGVLEQRLELEDGGRGATLGSRRASQV